MRADLGRLQDPRAFILQHTRLTQPPHAPELKLHLAVEAAPIWTLTEEALGARGVPPPYWAFAWAGGQGLARHLLDDPQTVAGKSVLDLGSGSGLVALAALRAGAARAIAADPDPFAAAAAELNAAANGLEPEVLTEDLLDGPPPLVDLVLAGDVFYEKPFALRCLAFLRRAAAQGSRVLIGDPGRSYLPKADLRLLSEHRVPVSRELEDQEIKRTGVFTFEET